jgi:peptidoglycan/LPS O-acetylase OafA/YrhL
MAKTVSAQESNPRLPGIDSLRFWLALWVYFSHFGLLPFSTWIGKNTHLRTVLAGVANNLFDGSAAVIGFFIISGLCIHYPYRSKPLELLPFYTRRYIRILVPLGVALAMTRVVHTRLNVFYHGILWSLVCEEIYYAIYPILRIGIRKLRWKWMLLGSYVAAIALIATNTSALNFHEFGPGLTWIAGLPCWLLGCHLAEVAGSASLQEVSFPRIWGWRFSMWGLGIVAGLLRFHAGIGYPITLTLMAPLLYYWLRLEIGRRQRVAALEYAGKFSYSMYLMHGVAVSILLLLAPSLRANSGMNGILRLVFVVGFSYCFFLFIERPSHQFARYAARVIGDVRHPRNRPEESIPEAAQPRSSTELRILTKAAGATEGVRRPE